MNTFNMLHGITKSKGNPKNNSPNCFVTLVVTLNVTPTIITDTSVLHKNHNNDMLASQAPENKTFIRRGRSERFVSLSLNNN